ncbi:MAG: VWA domain-containing protein [Acidobacteriota bacterium]
MGRLLAVLLAASCGLAAAAQGPTFRAGVDMATFGVTVLDRKNELVMGLTEDDFEIIEDGRRQTIAVFSRGDGDAVPLHLGLLLDTSGSMDKDLSLARTAAIKFLNLLPEAEDITLVDFDTEVRVTRYPQRDFARLVERIRMRKPDGWTALYDALGVYLDGADLQAGRKVLVMYSDGGDTRSTISYGDVLTLLKASQATLYVVGLTEHTGSYRTEFRMRMQQMAESTGGTTVYPSTVKDLDAAYEKVLAEIRAQYTVGYISTNTAQDGAWRRVEIKVKRPGVKIRSRKGYFAPYRSN